MQQELNNQWRAKKAGLDAFLTGASPDQLTALGRAFYHTFAKSERPIKNLRELQSAMEAACAFEK